jgi:hypothetical protein
MDNNPYVLAAMVDERLTRARDEARRLALLARARRPGHPLRARLGAGLIALGEWLRRDPVLAPAGRS